MKTNKQHKTLILSDFQAVLDDCFAITQSVTDTARAYHQFDCAKSEAEREGRNLIWVSISKEFIQAHLLKRMGYIIRPVKITNPGNVYMLEPSSSKTPHVVIRKFRISARNRKLVMDNYLALLKMFKIVEVPLTPIQKKQAGVQTIYGIEAELLAELRMRQFSRRRKRKPCKKETLEDKIDHISTFVKKDIISYISKTPEHLRVYNEFTSRPEKDKPSVKREDRAPYLYELSGNARLYEVDYRASTPQYIARKAGCLLILESIRKGEFYPQENRDEMKKTILKAIGTRFSEKHPQSFGYERLGWLSGWLSDKFGQPESMKFITKLIEIQSIHELYSYEEHQRDFCRKHPIGTVNLHDGDIFAGWTMEENPQLTDEMDAEKCEAGYGIIYSVKEITPGHERDLTEAWMKRQNV